MRVFLIIVFWLLVSPSYANQNNEIMKECIQLHNHNYTLAAGCYQDWKQGKVKQDLAELRDFLKHNPRYRVPGQSLNRCWGKPREMPFESAYIERTGDGFKAGVNYKDTMPAGCYENAPWDNRNAKN
jgi:hypothetical protein